MRHGAVPTVTPYFSAFSVIDRYTESSPARCSNGDAIPLRADAHTIYVEPEWSQLTYRFAETQGGWDKIEVTSGDGDAQVGGRFADPTVQQLWMDFHYTHANMAFATASASAQRTRARETDWTP